MSVIRSMDGACGWEETIPVAELDRDWVRCERCGAPVMLLEEVDA